MNSVFSARYQKADVIVTYHKDLFLLFGVVVVFLAVVFVFSFCVAFVCLFFFYFVLVFFSLCGCGFFFGFWCSFFSFTYDLMRGNAPLWRFLACPKRPPKSL